MSKLGGRYRVLIYSRLGTPGLSTIVRNGTTLTYITQSLQFTLDFTFIHSMDLDKHIITFIYHAFTILQNSRLYYPKNPVFSLFISPNPWQALIFLLALQFCFFLECDIIGIKQYIAFSDQFLLFSSMNLRFHCVFFMIQQLSFFFF